MVCAGGDSAHLVYQHPHGDAGHVEPIQKVLDGRVGLVIHRMGILQLQHPLGHRLHLIGVPVLQGLQSLAELGQVVQVSGAARLEFHQVCEALSIPILTKLYLSIYREGSWMLAWRIRTEGI